MAEHLTESTDAVAAGAPTAAGSSPQRSLWGDAWHSLRTNWVFWVAAVLILTIVVMAAFPGLFTRADPTYCELSRARQGPSAEAWFGYNLQGCDVFARTIHGARASVLVGLFATIGTLVFGSVIGIVAGFYGGWVDTVLSRIGDVFFAIPLLLGSIIILYTFPNRIDTPFVLMVIKVVLAIVILGWPIVARIMRSSVLQTRSTEYVMAARALGAGSLRQIVQHVLPNAFAPVVVVATLNLGQYIATEATLSFLGIGLQRVVSWGVDISVASQLGYIQAAPHMLIFPSIFLSVTVLAFILLGEAIRDALDPKLR